MKEMQKTTNLSVGCWSSQLKLSLLPDRFPLPSRSPPLMPRVSWNAYRKSVQRRVGYPRQNGKKKRNVSSCYTPTHTFTQSLQLTIEVSKVHCSTCNSPILLKDGSFCACAHCTWWAGDDLTVKEKAAPSPMWSYDAATYTVRWGKGM